MPVLLGAEKPTIDSDQLIQLLIEKIDVYGFAEI